MKRNVLGMILAGIITISVTGCGNSAVKDDEQAKNVKVQVPAKAGGGTDVMVRALANEVSTESGSAITTVNNTDGSGVVACKEVAAGRKDGSTLTQQHLTILAKAAAGLYGKSATEDFTVIGVAVLKDKANNVPVVSGGSSCQTLDDLIGAAREEPGKVMFGVETDGTIHIQVRLFAGAAGTDVRYVEVGSNTEELTVLVGNSIDARFVNANQAKQYVEPGRTRALGAIPNSDENGRSSVLPEVPDLIEQGVDFSFKMLNVVLVRPKDMDSELASRIHDYYTSAANDAEMVKTLVPTGMEMEFLSLEEGGSTSREMQGQIDTVVEEPRLRRQQE